MTNGSWYMTRCSVYISLRLCDDDAGGKLNISVLAHRVILFFPFFFFIYSISNTFFFFKEVNILYKKSRNRRKCDICLIIGVCLFKEHIFLFFLKHVMYSSAIYQINDFTAFTIIYWILHSKQFFSIHTTHFILIF